MKIWNLPHHPRSWHQLKPKSSSFHPFYAPCPHTTYMCMHPGPLQPPYTLETRFSEAPRLFSSRYPTLLKLWCVHEILLMLSFSKYIFNHAQEIHTKYALTRSSHKKLSIKTPKDNLPRISPLIHTKDYLQDSIAILFILSSSRSLIPFLGHLTTF